MSVNTAGKYNTIKGRDMSQIIYKEYDACEIIPTEAELSARLGGRASLSDREISDGLVRMRGVISAKSVGMRVDILRCGEGMTDLGFGILKSKHLYKNLTGYKQAYLVALTLGIGCDRFLNARSVLSSAEGYFYDAIGSAMCESLADLSEKYYTGGALHAPRFSIGYGDLDISYQKGMCEILRAERLIGISLSDNFFMTPKKSITYIVGIK